MNLVNDLFSLITEFITHDSVDPTGNNPNSLTASLYSLLEKTLEISDISCFFFSNSMLVATTNAT